MPPTHRRHESPFATSVHPPRHLPLAAWPVIAQSSDGIIPSDPGARVLFVLIGLGIFGLYVVLRRTRRRTEQAYWDRRRREEERRAADPDLRQDD